MIFDTEIKTSLSGVSQSIILTPGLWNLFVTAPVWGGGTSTIQVSSDDVTFFDAKDDSNTSLVFSENGVKEINGGIILRVNNSSAISNFYLVAKKAL